MIRHLSAFAALLAALLVVTGASLAAAQEASPVPSTGHPAHIHTGTCDTLGEVVFPLQDASAGDRLATPVAAATPPPEPAASPTVTVATNAESDSLTSTTTVEASLADILAAPHAINVHESPENIERYIACGDVRGSAESGEVNFLLRELNDSGYMGVATLTDNGDGTTTVVLSLWDLGS